MNNSQPEYLANKKVYIIETQSNNNMTKDRFLKVYSNLPADIRREIIVVIDDKPYTWDSAYEEIFQNTELGKKMLKKLIELELI